MTKKTYSKYNVSAIHLEVSMELVMHVNFQN
jgi:hypothetical protein